LESQAENLDRASPHSRESRCKCLALCLLQIGPSNPSKLDNLLLE
jgi:hypothetical protein